MRIRNIDRPVRATMNIAGFANGVIVFAIVIFSVPAFAESVQLGDVTIQRDEWGVAHIHGKTHVDTFFGMGYAQAEDYFWQLEETCVRSLGRYAEVVGDAGMANDILNRSFEIPQRSKEDFQKLKPNHQLMASAYAEGINRYLATHPETKPRLLTHFEPWYVLAMDRHMILDFLYRRLHVKRPTDRGPLEIAHHRQMADDHRTATHAWDIQSPTVTGFATEVQAAIGSNAWAIAGSRTHSGSAMLFVNPHQPWYGMGQFYEVHVRSDEGLNFSGACFFGNLFPTIGHNEHLGWTYTVNSPDVADAWRVTFDDATEPLHYRFDGAYREAVQWTEIVNVVQSGKMVQRLITFRKTHHGPIVSKENDTTFLAVQLAGLFDVKRVDQGMGMILATNFAEWRSAMSHCAIPMFNVVYADRAGNIFYAYNGTIPIRDPQFNWTQPVDGSDPRTEWKGIHTFDQLPQLLNPKSGFVQSCNSSPYTTTGNPDEDPRPENVPKYMLEDHDVDMRRSKMSRLLLGKAKDLTFEQLQVLAFDTTLYWPLTELPDLREEWTRLQTTDAELAKEVAPLMDHLSDWDCKSSSDSTQTTLCVAWYEELYGFGYPAETLKVKYTDRQQWFTALKIAAKKLKGLYGDWKHPWGKAHRLQRIADQPDVQSAGIFVNNIERSLPIAGAPGPLGIIHTVYSTPEIPLLRPQRYAVVGASYMSAVEFADPVRSVSVMPFGTSGERKSRHFFDQAELYSSHRFKPAWFTKEEVATHAKFSLELNR
ncbi:penicillin acylase family protein [Schlesneria paludicola]|uniref:penicillin acylase family protein n=1 Tax=Schlesneria paludicola TaxID=360056 RepID=UPI00029AFDDF|nr:penicillin acylase family protein [Schlesneria paludicola]